MMRFVLPSKFAIFFLLGVTTSTLFAYKQPVILLDDSGVNADLSSLTLSIKVDGVALTELTGGAQDEKVALQQILVTIPDANDKPIQYGETTVAGQNRSDEQYLDGRVTFTDADNKLNLKYDLTIRDNPNPQSGGGATTLKSIYAASKKVSVKVKFAYAEGGVLKSSDSFDQQDLTLKLAFPVEAPGNFAATNVFQGTALSWAVASSVKHVDGKYTKTPNQVVAIVFNQNAESSKVPPFKGFLPTTDPSATPEAIDCIVNLEDKANCLVCKKADNTPGYFDETQGASPADGLEKISVLPNTPKNKGESTAEGLIKDLDHENSYVVVLQYPKGVTRTQCLEVKPVDNRTFLELHGVERQKGDPRCFIVSAAFGSPFEKHVDIFRWFRDKFLLATDLGSKFVDFYYNHSLPLAETIKGNSFLQTATKAALWTPALFLYGLKYGTENPLGFMLFSSLILGCFVFGWRFLKTNKRRRI